MPIVKVGDKRIKFPDDMSREQIAEVLQKQFPVQTPPPAIARPVSTGGRSARARADGGDDVFVQLKKAVTGEERRTPVTDQLPELQESGLLSDNPVAAAKLAPVLLTTTDPEEIAKIITSSVPNVVATYNKDAAGRVFPILTNRNTGAQTIINRPGLTGMDVLQGLGLGAAYTPAGAARTVAGAAGKAALTESALQGGQAATGGEFDVEDVALATTFGTGGKVLENAASGAVQALAGRPAAESADLLRQAEAVDIPITTSDALPPQTFAARVARDTGEKIPVAGTGPLRQRQQVARERAVNDFTSRYGDYSYSTIVDSLKAQSDAVKKRAGNVLQQVGEKLDPIGEVPLDRTRQAIGEVTAELDKAGTIRNPAALDALQSVTEALNEAAPTFTGLKELRTQFRDVVKRIDKDERSQLTSRAKSLLERLQQAMTLDMRKAAQDNLSPEEFAKWERANAVYAEEAQKLTKSKLKNVLDKGDITPESVKPVLFSRNKSELDSLYKALGPSGRSNARAAIIDKIVTDLGRRANGATPTAFANEAKKYRPQINTFFKGKERAELEGLLRVLDATRRAQEANITTPTGQTLLGAGTAGAAVIDLGATLGTLGSLGAAARIYESPQVRNALLRLAAAPKGSRKYDQALEIAQTLLTDAVQVARSQPTEE